MAIAGPGANISARDYIPKLSKSVPESTQAFGALVSMGNSAVPALIEGMGSHDEMIRTLCAEALVKIGAREALISALNHGEWRVRAWSALALGEMQDASAVYALEQNLLNDDHWWVRAQCVVSLGQIGTESARFALNRAVNDPDSRVAERATIMLQKIG